MQVSYTAKATSDITCIAETDPAVWTGEDPDVPVRVRGLRDDGTVVIEGVISLWVHAPPGAPESGRLSEDRVGQGDHRSRLDWYAVGSATGAFVRRTSARDEPLSRVDRRVEHQVAGAVGERARRARRSPRSAGRACRVRR